MALTLAGLALTGCGTASYLAHVSLGQMRYLLDRELLTEERRARLAPEEREGLEAVGRARAFGEELGLAASTSYRHVIDRNAETAVQVVTAAPADRLAPVTWWFPVVGRISYRGYFDPERAERFARSLAERGYDTYVRPTLLYSTLGYFDDPIPLAVLRWDEIDLADVTLHEGVHETIFVSGDIDYNEALASFIAEKATLELYTGDAVRSDAARRIFSDRRRFAGLVSDLLDELETLYEAVHSADEARTARRAVFERYQGPLFEGRAWETERYRGFQGAELSNSYLLARRTYSGLLPCFEAEFEAMGRDLRGFIAAHRETPGHRIDAPACAEGN